MRNSLKVFLGFVGAALHLPVSAAIFTADFNTGTVPVGTTITSNAAVTATGGVGNTGVLRLTEAINSELGEWIISDFSGGEPVNSFTANFKVQMGPGSGADGFSFNWSTNFLATGIAEEGDTNGLSVCFDTYNNGSAEAPAIDIKWNGVVIAHSAVPFSFTAAYSAFVPVQVIVTNGAVSIAWNGSIVHANVNLSNFAFLAGAKFRLGARTGSVNERHYIDDVSIATVIYDGFSMNGIFTADFNTGTVPSGTTVISNAVVTAAGGVTNSGVLRLTEESAGQAGAWTINDFFTNAPISYIHARFKVKLHSTANMFSRGDGFSFCWANDLPPYFNEEGAGSGLIVSFDTYNNGGESAPEVTVRWNGATVANTGAGYVTYSAASDNFVPVDIIVRTNTITVVFNGYTFHSEVALPGFTFLNGAKFGFGSRTGLYFESHYIDDVSILVGAESPPVAPTFSLGPSFTMVPLPGAGVPSFAMVTEDVNVDGKLDLVCANYGNATLAILTNKGSDGFALHATLPTVSYPSAVISADINGDGKADLISAGSGNLTAHTNNGSGGYSNPISLGFLYTQDVTAGDINEDDKMDLIIGDYANIRVLTNNGSGEFSVSTTIPVIGDTFNEVEAKDVTGDGKLELIYLLDKDDEIIILTNNGSGGFQISSIIDDEVSNPGEVAFVDINDDDKLDMVVADYSLVVLTNRGDGIFAMAFEIGTNVSWCVTTDFNNDDKPDVATMEGESVLILTNNGNGGLVSSASLPTGFLGDIAAVEVDGNGKMDVVGARYDANELMVLLNTPLVDRTTFTIGRAKSFNLTFYGHPMPSLSIDPLPSGLVFNSSSDGTASISGTPAPGTAGVYHLTVTAAHLTGITSLGLILTINELPFITSASTKVFLASSSNSFTVTATGDPSPVISKSGTLPAGVTFTNGVFSGTPAPGSVGIYNLVLAASNTAGTITQNFTLTVAQKPLITSSNSVAFAVGYPGSLTIKANGFPAPVFSASGTLPSGITLLNGILSGTAAGGSQGTYPLTLIATNVVGTNTQNFTLTVTMNDAPAFDLIGNQAAAPNLLLKVPLVATDPEGDAVTFSLEPGAAAGATISSNFFLWRPTLAQALSTNVFTVRATDNGLPPLSTTRTFTVVVGNYLNLKIGRTNVEPGEIARVPLTLSSKGVTELTLTIDLETNRFTNATLTPVSPVIGASSIVYQTNSVVIHLQAGSGQSFLGTQQVARLNLYTDADGSSADVLLPISSVLATNITEPVGYDYDPIGDGRVIIVEVDPVLEAFLLGSTNYSLLNYGRVGVTYQLQNTFSLLPPVVWQPVFDFSQTNRITPLNLPATNSLIFYRTKRLP